MRVAGDMSRNLLFALDNIREQSDQALEQLSTGRRVNAPSDDPAAASGWLAVRSEMAQTDQFARNLSGLRMLISTADSALNGVVSALTRAISLGTQGGSGTVSAEQRQALAEEVGHLQEQVVDLANTSVNGVYLFAGTEVSNKPYAMDPLAASGVTYAGNNSAVSVEISKGQVLQTQTPGSEIFNASGNDVFQALHDLYQALTSGGDVAAATAAVKSSLEHVSLQRISYGSALAQLDQTEQSLGDAKVQLSAREDDLVGADLAEVASRFSRIQTALNAAIQAGGKASQLSLLDFLP